MHRRSIVAALALVPLLLTGCEQKTETPPAPASTPAATPAAPKAAAPAADASGAKPGGFELVSTTPIGALQIDIQYKGDGKFVGDADAVACETKVEGALSSYNHIAGEKMLRAAFVAVKGFAGPVRFSECKYQGAPKPEDFTIAVKDSSTPDLAPVEPAPTIKVVVN